jgi:hypothetical protein
MKLTTISVILCFITASSFSCEKEETGYCQPIDPATGCGLECRPGFTESKCKKFNNDKTEGYNWVFHDGDIPCVPDPPSPGGGC